MNNCGLGAGMFCLWRKRHLLFFYFGREMDEGILRGDCVSGLVVEKNGTKFEKNKLLLRVCG